MPKCTFRELLEIQAQHLAEWGKVLKPKAHAYLVKQITEQTAGVHPDALDRPVNFDQGADHAIPRGTAIDQVVHNLHRLGNWD